MKSQENEQTNRKKIKVTRSRKRLYEAPPEVNTESSKSNSTGKPQKKQTTRKNKSSSLEKKEVLKEKASDTKPKEIDNNKNEADRLIQKYSYIAAGTGVIPLPVLDIAMVTGTQLKLIKELASLYNIPFSYTKAKAVLTGLLSGVGAHTLATGSFSSMLRFIPVFGTVLNLLIFPAAAGAATYAAGTVFQLHFESGGTIDDFSISQYKKLFREKTNSGKRVLQKQK